MNERKWNWIYLIVLILSSIYILILGLERQELHPEMSNWELLKDRWYLYIVQGYTISQIWPTIKLLRQPKK